MTIGSINLAMSASSWGAYAQKLTNETRQKLLELNIPFDEGITENQAKALIAKELQKPNKANNSKDEKSPKNSSSLLEQALQLAKKLNIEVDKEKPLEELLSEIEEKLSSKINQNKDNKSTLVELLSLSEALSNLQAQAQGTMGYNNSDNLMKSLELMSEYNKNFLNK